MYTKMVSKVGYYRADRGAAVNPCDHNLVRHKEVAALTHIPPK